MAEQKYINLLTDYGFKRVFGDKELLKAFLNALLEKDGKVITSVTYINKEMTPQFKEDRTIFYDVLCKIDGEEDIIIEMQHKSQDTFRERAIFYMSRAFDRQAIGKKRWKYKLHSVYGIFITNFHLKEVQLHEHAVSEYVITNRDTGELFTNKFRMFFIDLLTFNKKTEDELETDLDKWIYSIKNMGTMTSAPRMASSGIFRQLYSAAELAAMTTRQRHAYETSLKNYRDLLADRETTRNRIKASREEGIEIGDAIATRRERQKAHEEKLAIARSMKEQGISLSIITQCTGLTEGEF